MKGAPLTGVKVVDLSTTFAGPYASMFLSMWGADVTKVEARDGDVARFIGDVNRSGMGPAFLTINRGKRSIVVDVKTEAGRGILDDLVAGADVFLHNLRPGAAERLGLHPDTYTSRHPGLVFVHLRGFGEAGPDGGRPAYDDVIQAGSGMAAVQGGEGPPAYVRSAVADKTVGVYAAAAVLAALVRQRETGTGGYVEVPMFETMAGFTLVEQQGGFAFRPPQGPVGYPRTASPHRRPFQTADGHLAVMIYTDAQWHAFFELAGVPEWSADPRFGSIRERTLYIDDLYSLVADTMRTQPSAHWIALLDAVGIPCGRVNTVEDLFSDPHLAESGFFDITDHPSEGPLQLPTTGVTFDRTRFVASPAPRLGQHTRDVLAELGHDPGARAELERAGAVWSASADDAGPDERKARA